MAVKLLFSSILFILLFRKYDCGDINNMIDEDALTTQAYVFWPNATVPFYIEADHFDKEQTVQILSALAQFAFKTCLKFAPVMAPPENTDHVLVLENPTATRKCVINADPHSVEEPHRLSVGYECLKPPQIDMLIMKALGFPFEHNRAVRDIYITVQPENVEPAYLDLFTRDLRLPVELRSIPYDPNSVMHFGERDYSKNGHRTIIFKNRNFRQERYSLSALDLRRIDIVYGPECRKRDRQEKIELCQNYPGVARRKREITNIRSLRVNPDITPPPGIGLNDTKHDKIKFKADDDSSESKTETIGYAHKVVKQLAIQKEVEDLIEQVHKIGAAALSNAREKFCNESKNALRTEQPSEASGMKKPGSKNLLDIIGDVANYAQSLVDKATKNLTEFCAETKSLDDYQRSSCPFFDVNKCKQSYKSTKGGPVKASTNHRPVYKPYTRNERNTKNIFDNMFRASEDENGTTPEMKREQTESEADVTTPKSRRKSDLRNTRIVVDKKAIFAPLYRSTNDSLIEKPKAEETVRRKREVEELHNLRRLNQKRFNLQKNRDAKPPPPPPVQSDPEEEKWDSEQPSAETTPPATKRQKSDKVKGRIPVKEKEVEKEYDEIRNDDNVYYEKPTHGKVITNKDYSEERREEDLTSSIATKATTRTTSQAWKNHNLKFIGKLDPEMRAIHAAHAAKSARTRSTHPTGPINVSQRPRSIRVPRTIKLSKKNVEFYNERIWPDNIVRYAIHDSGDFDIEDVRARLNEVNDILKEKTCTRLEEITEEQGELFEDYLVLDNSPDYVTGRVGGRQNFGVIELLKGGQHRQHTAMMVMAMLGFYFEVSRHDRDKYIRVHMRHIRPDKLHHFEKIRDDATFDLPYDYESATHPAWQFWRQIGKAGISTVATYKELDPDGIIMKSLGQNINVLSDYDIIKINSVYGIECFTGDSKEIVETKVSASKIKPARQHRKGNKGENGPGRGQKPKTGRVPPGIHGLKEEGQTDQMEENVAETDIEE